MYKITKVWNHGNLGIGGPEIASDSNLLTKIIKQGSTNGTEMKMRITKIKKNYNNLFLIGDFGSQVS